MAECVSQLLIDWGKALRRPCERPGLEQCQASYLAVTAGLQTNVTNVARGKWERTYHQGAKLGTSVTAQC